MHQFWMQCRGKSSSSGLGEEIFCLGGVKFLNKKIVSKNTSKNIGALICSMRFLSAEVVFYVYKSTNGLAWNTVTKPGLVLSVALWIR